MPQVRPPRPHRRPKIACVPWPLAFLAVILSAKSGNNTTRAQGLHQDHQPQNKVTAEVRFILKMGEGETIAERHASWRVLHQAGYSCWLGRRSFASAVCVLVGYTNVLDTDTLLAFLQWISTCECVMLTVGDGSILGILPPAAFPNGS